MNILDQVNGENIYTSVIIRSETKFVDKIMVREFFTINRAAENETLV